MTRRLVTGRDATGRFALVADGEPPTARHYQATPGFADALIWHTTAPLRVPDVVADPTVAVRRWVPGPGESLAMTVTFPPDAVRADRGFDADAARQENLALSPGLAELFEADNPGMHTTATIDYVVVLSGTITLDLDGETADLHAGDVVVQNGARHAWRNRTSEPATVFVVLLGANP